MSSIRSIYILISDNPNRCLFSRKFPTIENRLRLKMGDTYIGMPVNDKTISNSFFKQVIREELLQEEFKFKTYKEDLEIDHLKMDELIKVVDVNLNVNNFEHYSECPIVTLDIGNNKSLWPCIYIKKYKLYGIVFPNIDYEKYKSITHEVIEKQNKANEKLQEADLQFRIKKLYEEQDISIVGSFTLIENLLNYIISAKVYEENKLHTLISNMVPFGNIIETNINFMLESLNFLNQRFVTSSSIFSNFMKTNTKNEMDEKIKIPGWATKIPTNSSENLNIVIKEELKFVKYPQEKTFNVILCDISCLADLSSNCEITLPLKESNKMSYLGNLRIHPCSKLEDQNILNEATRIIFIPPHDEFKLGVFEIENIEQKKLPIIANLQLKEASQNEVKIYLKVEIEESSIGKFDYFYINIPLGHFGMIIDTKIMVQVGEVSLINSKTTLHWDLQNKVFDSTIVLSGTVYYNNTMTNSQMSQDKNITFSSSNINEAEFSESSKIFEEMKFSKKQSEFIEKNITCNIEDMIKSNRYSTTSDIRFNNCFCKIHFKLNNYSLSNIEIDKKSLLFYPKISPKIDIRRQFISNDYIIWNDLSFNNYEINIPEKNEISLLKINIEESNISP